MGIFGDKVSFLNPSKSFPPHKIYIFLININPSLHIANTRSPYTSSSTFFGTLILTGSSFPHNHTQLWHMQTCWNPALSNYSHNFLLNRLTSMHSRRVKQCRAEIEYVWCSIFLDHRPKKYLRVETSDGQSSVNMVCPNCALDGLLGIFPWAIPKPDHHSQRMSHLSSLK